MEGRRMDGDELTLILIHAENNIDLADTDDGS